MTKLNLPQPPHQTLPAPIPPIPPKSNVLFDCPPSRSRWWPWEWVGRQGRDHRWSRSGDGHGHALGAATAAGTARPRWLGNSRCHCRATAAIALRPRFGEGYGHGLFSHGTVAAATGRETGSVTGEPRFGHSHEFDDGLASARQGSVTARSRLAPPRPRP